MPWVATWPCCGNAPTSRARSFWRVFRIGAIARRRATSLPCRVFHAACEATRSLMHADVGSRTRIQARPPVGACSVTRRASAAAFTLQQAVVSFPIRFAAEVGMDLLRPARVGHSRPTVAIETGRLDKSLKVDIDDASLVDTIDGYRAPGNRNHFLTYAQKASNSHHRVGNVP